MRQVRRGFSIRLRITHKAAGALADPDSYKIDVKDSVGQFAYHDDGASGTEMDNQSMSKESTGILYYDLKIMADAATGIYQADYKCTTGTFVAGPPQKEYFEVVEEVD
jgi:hypothetical protein